MLLWERFCINRENWTVRIERFNGMHVRIICRYAVLALAGVVACLGAYLALSTSRDEGVSVAFLDVGQGDGILISSGSRQILIDGGANAKVLRERLSDTMPFGDKDIELLLPTHPDADHIGALSDMVVAYRAGAALETNARKDTSVFRAWSDAKDRFGIDRIIPKYGTRVVFANGAALEVLAPHDGRNVSDLDANDASIVARLDYGEHAFLFTGDITDRVEKEIFAEDIDVLKVAHHGSKSSSSEAFLGRVRPGDAVVSAGADNRYGHPHADVLGRLRLAGARVLRTDEAGTIVYSCRSADDPCEISTAR